MQDEEERRNSVMLDMLFVSLSHPLSPYIFSLDHRCKQLTEKERIEVKEPIDPGARFVLQYLLLYAVCSYVGNNSICLYRWVCFVIYHYSFFDDIYNCVPYKMWLCTVVEWMAIYPSAVENLVLQFLDHLFKEWRISWITKSCKKFGLLRSHYSQLTE